MILAVAVAILVVGSCLALVFDRLWVDAARVELQAAAESAALAGAGELATDHLLQQPDSDRRDLVLAAAVHAGGINFVTGSPVELQTGEEGDVLVGTIEADVDTGDTRFVLNTPRPTTCQIRAARLKSRGNPVAQFFQELTGQWHADVIAYAEASVDNRIIGVAPTSQGPVPALPMAILHTHLDPRRQDTWQRQIELKMGFDRYSYDAVTGEVYASPDGIPEMLLHTASLGADEDDSEKANLLALDIGTGLREPAVVEQIRTGWTLDHLASFGHEFRIDQGPQQLNIDSALLGPIQESFDSLVGQTRICGLYTGHQASSDTLGQAAVVTLVAVRILAVEDVGGQKMHLTVQPAVIVTRTAILNHQNAAWLPDRSLESTNPYIHKLFLSH